MSGFLNFENDKIEEEELDYDDEEEDVSELFRLEMSLFLMSMRL